MLDHGHPAPDSEPPPSPWLVPILTFGVTIAVLSARALVVFLPVLAADLRTSVALLGQVPAMMLLLAGILALVAGPLADRYGFRRTLVVGLLTVVVSAVATGLAPNLPILLAVTLVGALARASVLPTAQSVAVAAFAEEDARRRAVSWVSTGIAVPTIVGIPIMTAIAGLTNWRVSFFLMGGMGLVAAVVLQWTLRDSAPRTTEPLRVRDLLDSYEPLRRHRPTVLVILATLAADTGLWCTTTYLSAFLVQQHGFTIADAGWVFLAIGLLALAGTVVGGGRGGAAPRPLLIGCRALSAICLCASFALPVSWPVSVGVLLLAAPSIGLADLATTLILTEVSPAGRATTLTLRSAAVCIGSALGAIVGGLLLALGGYPALGVCSLALLLLATALVWWSRPQAAPTPSLGTA